MKIMIRNSLTNSCTFKVKPETVTIKLASSVAANPVTEYVPASILIVSPDANDPLYCEKDALKLTLGERRKSLPAEFTPVYTVPETTQNISPAGNPSLT